MFIRPPRSSVFPTAEPAASAPNGNQLASTEINAPHSRDPDGVELGQGNSLPSEAGTKSHRPSGALSRWVASLRNRKRGEINIEQWLVGWTVILLSVWALTFLARWFALADMICQFSLQLGFLLAGTSVALWIRRRRVWATIALAATAPVLIHLIYLEIPASQPPPGPQRLRVLSLNVFYHNPHTDRVEQLIDRLQPDIISLQEVEDHWEDFVEQLRDRYPYIIRGQRTFTMGNALLSRYPLEYFPTPRNPRPDPYMPVLMTKMTINGQRIWMLSVHTTSPTSLSRTRVRNLQLQHIARLIGELEGPVIVTGDLNVTSWAPVWRDLKREGNLRDTRRGFGLLTTWPAFWWGWPLRVSIDQILISSEFHVHQRWVESPVGSDHLPIVADLSLTPQ